MDTSFVSFIAALDPLVLMLATGALVILMLHASAAKLGDRDLFMQHLAAYGVPDAALGAMTWALPLAELVAALPRCEYRDYLTRVVAEARRRD